MRVLDRKLLRDLTHLRGQALAILSVIAAGVATFVMSMCCYRSLEVARHQYYQQFRFADVFAITTRTPRPMLTRLQQISGVATAEARLVYDVLLDIEAMSEPATGRLISVPDGGQSRLNQLFLTRGRMMQPEQSGEVVVSEAFADAHQFALGDKVTAIINGRKQDLTIVGVALSPEYVIEVQPGSILPDEKRFGVFWISERDLEAAFDVSGAFNSLAVRLAWGNRSEEVLEELDRLLEPFGSLGAYDRSDHPSHQYLSDELRQLRSMAIMMPAIFLGVAAFLLQIAISRIINQQREQIATLKAFGYSNLEIFVHYLNLVLVISLGGALLGTLVGLWMGSGLIEMYGQFYRFPQLPFRIHWHAVAGSTAMTCAVGIASTATSVRRAVALRPAEAMRPEPPASYRPALVERMLPRKSLTPEMRMVVRNLTRRPLKAMFSMLGIATAVAVMILGNFSLDSMNYLMHFQFNLAQRQDLTVMFVEPATESVMYEVRHLDGVLDSETNRTVAVRMKYQNRSRRVALMGLEPNPRLFRLLDDQERPVTIPSFGVMLNTKLAELLGVRVGDTVTIDVLEGERNQLTLEVTALVEEYTGTGAYLNKQFLHQLLEESEVATGAFLRVDENRIDQVFRELERRPGVASVTIKDAAMESFETTVAENVLVMRSFIAGFAAVIAIGVVYNTARISLSERTRDLATMRVIGFTRGEVSTVLLGEILLLTLAALPLGALIGYGLAGVAVAGLDTENYRIPLVVGRRTYLLAWTVVVAATLGSALVVRRQIDRLDLVAVLKSQD